MLLAAVIDRAMIIGRQRSEERAEISSESQEEALIGANRRSVHSEKPLGGGTLSDEAFSSKKMTRGGQGSTPIDDSTPGRPN